MKKNILLAIALFQFIRSTIASCHLSRIEEKEALKKFAPSQNLKCALDDFFSRSEVQDALFKSIIRQIYHEHKDDNAQMFLWETLCSEQEKKAAALFKKYNITNLAEHQEIQNSYVLISEKWWPNFVVKIPRQRRYQETISIFHFRSRYQNISRVFYNEQIKKLTLTGRIKHVYPLNKYLYHIPGKPKILSDENYFVVSERIPNLPTIEENKKIFNAMINKEKNVIKAEYLPFIDDIVTIIANSGLGDIAQQNIFFTRIQGTECIVFVDTEKNGKCNRFDSHFFNKNFSEIDLNRRWGLFNFFVRFFNIVPEDSIFLMNEILFQHKKSKKTQRYHSPINLLMESQ